jgi:hypothetical protein
MTSASAPAFLVCSEPILAVADVVAAVRFYRDKLGFTNEWLWGEPPTFGRVSWGKVGVMFCLQPALAAKIEGHQQSFFVSGIDQLHERHCGNGVQVIPPWRPSRGACESTPSARPSTAHGQPRDGVRPQAGER